MKNILKLLFISVVLAVCLSTTAFAEKVTAFSDLPETHWAYSTVMPMVERGLFNGTSAAVNGVGTFSPDKPMTRGEFLAVVCREYFKDEIYAPSPDLPWWDPYFTIAVKYELIDYQREYLDLSQPMTRGEAVLIIERTLEAEGKPLKYYDSSFPDHQAVVNFEAEMYHSTNNWSYVINATCRCVGSGIIGGVDANGTFDPRGKLTRAAAATIICRMYDESKRIHTSKMDENENEMKAHLAECAKGNHYITDHEYGPKLTVDGRPMVEEIKPATAQEEGVYRINCRYCDYYVDVPFRKHTCYCYNPQNTAEIRLSCGDHYWNGDYCDAGTYTGINDSYYLALGEERELVIYCKGTVSRIRQTNSTVEEATHDFQGDRIVSLPGKGVEGLIENRCSKCEERSFKILPMYSSNGTTLDVRGSYSNYVMGSARPSNDVNVRNVERVQGDFTRSVEDNNEIFSNFLYETAGLTTKVGYGITQPGAYAIPLRTIGSLVRSSDGTRWGLNIFCWRVMRDDSVPSHLEQSGMELVYFVVHDREVTFALCQLVDYLFVNGGGAATEDAINKFGFKLLKKGNNSIEFYLKDISICMEWGGDIEGYNFFFGNITRNV